MKTKYLSRPISNIYVCVIFTLFPLIMHNKLFDIVETKRNWFVGITIVFGILCLLCALSSRQKVRLKPVLPDYFMIGFILSNILSYILSSNKSIAFYGANGRAFGLFTVIFIGFSYFVITRFVSLDKYIFTCIMIGSSVIAVIGILNFFGIDLFGIYSQMESSQTDFYISTLGHTNIYSSYFALTLPIGVILYIKSDSKKSTLFYLITTLISLSGLIVGNSDSGYITLGAILILVPIAAKSNIELARFCFLLICGIIIQRLFGIIYVLTDCKRLTDSITKIFLTENYLLPVVILLSGFMLFLIHNIRNKKNNFKHIRRIILTIASICILSLISVTIYANISGYDGSLSNLLVWSDHWGSNRGFVWTRGFQLFTQHYNLAKILFGCGPDCIQPLLEQFWGDEMILGVFEHYDNVHNEYLQYLLTIGIAGLFSYLGLLFASIRKFAKHNLHDTYYLSVLCAMICYMLQATVNINQAVTTPMFFVMVAMAATTSD